MLDILHTNFAGEHRSDRSLSAEYPVSVRLRYMLHCNVVKKLVKKLVVKKKCSFADAQSHIRWIRFQCNTIAIPLLKPSVKQ